MWAGRGGEITRVFVDRITRSGKSTEIKAKPRRKRKHVKLAERRTKPHLVRHRRRPVLNNYSNSLTCESGCVFVGVPPTVPPPPFLCTDFPREVTVLPLFMWVHISSLLFTVFPLWFMTSEKHCIQVMIHSIISTEMVTTVKELLYCMVETKQKKGASRVQGKSAIFVIWTVGCKVKNALSPIIPLPEWALILKKCLRRPNVFNVLSHSCLS